MPHEGRHHFMKDGAAYLRGIPAAYPMPQARGSKGKVSATERAAYPRGIPRGIGYATSGAAYPAAYPCGW